MKNLKGDSHKMINNLVAKIKARYPHLYEETGGRYIRETLRRMLENDDAVSTGAPMLPVISPSPMHLMKTEYSSNKYAQANRSISRFSNSSKTA